MNLNRAKRAAVVATVLTVSLAACSPAANTQSSGVTLEEMEPITLKFSSPLPEQLAESKSQVSYLRQVEELSDGKINFEYYWGGTLADAAGGLQALKSGLVDLVATSPGYHPTELEVNNWVAAASYSKVEGFPARYIQGVAAAQEFYTNTPDILDEYAAQGARPLIVAGNDDYRLICNEPVRTASDAAGKFVRVGGEAWAEQAQHIGMVTQFLPPTEVYEAMQRGVIDCAINFTVGIATFSWWDNAKYVPDVHFAANDGSPVLISTKIWDELPESAREVFEEARASYVESKISEDLRAFAAFYEEAESHGVSLVEAPELRKEIRAHGELALATMAERAPSTVANPQRVIDDYLLVLDKWADRLGELGYELGYTAPESMDFGDKWLPILEQLGG